MNASAGEIWLAEGGDVQRRPVFVISDDRFHRLSRRAVVAPVLDAMPAACGHGTSRSAIERSR